MSSKDNLKTEESKLKTEEKNKTDNEEITITNNNNTITNNNTNEENKKSEKEEYENNKEENNLHKSIDKSYYNESEIKDKVNEIEETKNYKKNNILDDSYLKEDKSINKSKFKQSSKKEERSYEMFDFLFPGGKLAKMCKVNNELKAIKSIPSIIKLLKFEDPNPIILLLGQRDSGRGKFLAGLTRAAFRTDALIIDNGLLSGIESFCIRRDINLIGVFPEFSVKMPKINPSIVHPDTLTNGHSHLFMLAEKSDWGFEVNFKFKLANELSLGSLQKRQEMNKCKIVGILTGEHESVIEDLKQAIDYNIPIIVIEGSDICNNIIKFIKKDEESILSDEIKNLLSKAHLFPIDSKKSEDLASLTHFLLTVTPY